MALLSDAFANVVLTLFRLCISIHVVFVDHFHYILHMSFEFCDIFENNKIMKKKCVQLSKNITMGTRSLSNFSLPAYEKQNYTVFLKLIYQI